MLRNILKLSASASRTIRLTSTNEMSISIPRYNEASSQIQPDKKDVDRLFTTSNERHQQRRNHGFSVNRVELIGGVASDPAVRVTSSNSDFVSLQLATNVSQKKASGDVVEYTDFHEVLVFGKTATFVKDNVKKGHKLYITGRISNGDRVTPSGDKVKRVVIIADVVQFFGVRKD
uniref:Single-stranded DNA-binding protein n=1 Tax=Parastrongyloides trichosuri TaxID=131310 RepID=A0A0N4ZPN9_PARTI